jgi:Flp pilus assembly protein TadB
MNLNDPFGRMARKHQRGYEMMRDVMRKGAVDTPYAAQEIIRQSKTRAVKFLAIGLVLFLLVIWLVPQAFMVAFCLLLFLVVWVLTSTINGKRYIERYIDEELK